MKITPKPLRDITDEYKSQIDLFICGASFEDRCRSIPVALSDKIRGRTVILFNSDFEREIEKNLQLIIEAVGTAVERILVSSNNPVLSYDNIFCSLRQLALKGAQSVVIDITSVTHETLMMLYHVVSQCFTGECKVKYVYATADDYSLGVPKPKKWLSKGIKEIRSVMGYPGRLVPSKSNHLIVLLGFEEYRAYAVIKEFEPSLLSVGYGDASEESTGPHQETNETKLRRLRSLVGDVNEFQFSCYDPLLAEHTLQELVTQKSNYNNIIAPMNTKPSTMGAARCALKNESVQLCYAQPEVYNVTNYSLAGTQYYEYAFDSIDLVPNARPR